MSCLETVLNFDDGRVPELETVHEVIDRAASQTNVGEVRWGGEWEGGPARTALRTLRTDADCAYIVFHLYYFPFCHL